MGYLRNGQVWGLHTQSLRKMHFIDAGEWPCNVSLGLKAPVSLKTDSAGEWLCSVSLGLKAPVGLKTGGGEGGGTHI